MPLVVVTFLDGDVLYAETPELTFELPAIEAELRNVDSNGERALLPLTAIRQIIVGQVEAAPAAAEMVDWDRAAFDFLDGHVLRAAIAPDAMLGRHGGIWRICEPGRDEVATLGIPYSALKGVFQIRSWDADIPLERARTRSPRHAQVVTALAEREQRSQGLPPKGPDAPLMDAVRRASGSEGAPR